jgi:hypothetical protein
MARPKALRWYLLLLKSYSFVRPRRPFLRPDLGRAERRAQARSRMASWPPPQGGAQRPWCARHGPWIGGGSPLRSKLEATASRRQLHAGGASRDNPAWRREAVWGRSRRRAAAPNVSEALCRPGRSGERAKERDAQNPTEIGAVLGPGAAVHSVSLPWEVCMGPRRAPHRA